jgi:glutamyl/glutaminyl-tRNA synthetase
LRAAVTGGTISPPIDITLELIGKDRVLKRITNVFIS